MLGLGRLRWVERSGSTQWNNPTNLTDPTGFMAEGFWSKMFSGISDFFGSGDGAESATSPSNEGSQTGGADNSGGQGKIAQTITITGSLASAKFEQWLFEQTTRAIYGAANDQISYGGVISSKNTQFGLVNRNNKTIPNPKSDSQITHPNGKPVLAPNLSRTTSMIARGGILAFYDASGNLITKIPNTSGRNGETDPSVKNRGPIPPGRYTLNPENITLNGPSTLLSGDWGVMRAALTPVESTNTFGRSGFYLHGGFAPGSAGCIDIGTRNDFSVLSQLQEVKRTIQVEVLND